MQHIEPDLAVAVSEFYFLTPLHLSPYPPLKKKKKNTTTAVLAFLAFPLNYLRLGERDIFCSLHTNHLNIILFS